MCYDYSEAQAERALPCGPSQALKMLEATFFQLYIRALSANHT